MARLMQACVWIGLFALQCGNASAIVIDAVRDPVSAIVPNLTTDQFAGVGSVNGGCTGTVIGRQTVLTAAHCFAPGVTRSQFRLPFDDTPDVFASGDVITFPGYDRTIPSFDQTQTPDLAILSLDNQLPDFIPQYRLADFETNPSQIAIELVGFGNTGTGLTGQVPGTNSSTTKRFGLNDVDLFEANGNYFTGDFDPSFSNLNILGTQGTGILEVIPGQGDSGGPAFYNPKTSLDIALERADINSFSGDVLDELFVLGVTSYGTTFLEDQEIGSYFTTATWAYVSPYIDWLEGFDDTVSSFSLSPLFEAMIIDDILNDGEDFQSPPIGAQGSPSEIPVPTAFPLFLSGLVALGVMTRRTQSCAV